jgi:hypothetical protein
MSFLNGATLVLNHKPATSRERRMLAHAARMQAKRNRSPSRVAQREALARWREESGYPVDAPVYPENWVAA